MKLMLIVGTPKARRGRVIPISKATFIIGRDSTCQLRIDSERISRQHCTLHLIEERAYIQDMQSTNGTFINDERIDGVAELHDGDRLQIGPAQFEIMIAHPSYLSSVEEVAAEMLLADEKKKDSCHSTEKKKAPALNAGTTTEHTPLPATLKPSPRKCEVTLSVVAE